MERKGAIMRSFLGVGVLVCALTTAGAADEIRKAELGKVVPDLSWKNLQGKEVSLASFRKTSESAGKPLLLVFWSYKCPSGKALLSQVEEAAAKSEKEGIGFIGICSYGESEADLKKFAEERGLRYTLCFDEGLKGAKLFDAKVVTAAVVLDRDGKLAYRGAWNKAWDAAAALAAGREVEVKETKAFG
jgi:peroxiredoxin